MPKVTFVSDDVTLDVADNASLQDVAQDNNLSVPFGCTNGICGTCLITVKEGAEHISPQTDQEKETLGTLMAQPNQRLACQCKVAGDITFDLE